MRDHDLSSRGKAVFGALCAACCGLPMLVILGFVSVGVVFTAGVAIASAFVVVVVAYRVVRHRAVHVPVMARRMLVAGGAGLSGLGLWLARSASDFAPGVLSVAVAVLATAALLALASARGELAVR